MKDNTILTIKEYELPIVIEEEKGGYFASCPVWQDCYAQGDTIEEAISEISEVAAGLIELYQEENMPIPLKLKTKREQKRFSINFPLIISSN